MVASHFILMPPSLGPLQFASVPETLSRLPPPSTLFQGVSTWERSIKPALLVRFSQGFPHVELGVAFVLRAVFGMRQGTDLGLSIQTLCSWVGFKLKSWGEGGGRKEGVSLMPWPCRRDLGGWSCCHGNGDHLNRKRLYLPAGQMPTPLFQAPAPRVEVRSRTVFVARRPVL